MDSSPLDLSPQDRDLTIRTMLGEAANQGDDGMAGVANVVLNRLAAGRYGKTASDVVTAPAQFTPWQTRRNELLSYSPDSPGYQRAGQILDAAVSGGAPDITGGATHFFAPDLVSAPAWNRNVTAKIGGHVFSAPEGTVQRQAMAPNANPDDVFSELMTRAQGNSGAPQASGAAQPGQAQASAIASAAAPQPSVDDVFGELTAHAAQNAKPAAQAIPAATTPPTNPGVTPPIADTPQNTGDAAAAIGRGILDIPVAGPLIEGSVERAAAWARQKTFGGSYEDALKHVQQFGANTAEAHPYATMAGQALGTGTAMAPVMAAAPAAFGAGGLSAGSIAAGAGTGATIGGLDTAVRQGADPYAIAKGALVGGAFGAAGPVVAGGIGYGANKLINLGADVGAWARDGISASSRNLLMDAINRDGPETVTNQLQQLGPNAMLADAGSAVQGLAQGTAVRPNGSALIQAIKDRAAGTNARIRDAVANLGPAEDPQTVTDNILALRKAQDDANYGAVRANAPAVDVSNVVALIDRQLGPGGAEGAQKTALQNLRDKLVTAPAKPATPAQPSAILDASGNPVMTPGTPAQPAKLQDAFNNLHNIRQEIDGLIDNSAPGLGVERGAVNRQQGSLQAVRSALDDALKTQVPGMAEADAASAALVQRAKAVQDGVDTLGSGKTTPTPGRFIDEFNQKPVGAQIAQAKGLLGEINRLVGTKANDLGAMRTALQGEEGWNTTKMGRVLGTEPVNRLMDAVGQEGQFGQTYNKVVGNAQSAFRTESSKALDQQSPFGLNLDVSHVSTPGIILGAAKNMVYNPLVKILATTDTATRDAELARILSMQGPARDAFVNRLFQAAGYRAGVPAWAGALGRAGNALTNASQEPYRLAR